MDGNWIACLLNWISLAWGFDVDACDASVALNKSWLQQDATAFAVWTKVRVILFISNLVKKAHCCLV